ncbi:MAG: YigZ family protein [Saprospiraceae bacterium]|nr:YigZ family protein [Saprospiraceae bacterium]
MKDRFLTLKSRAEGYYMERGSKFHAYAFPVQTEEEVLSIVQTLKKVHPKARHFCSALRLYPDASLERANDDGEPSGSAGKPILGQLIKHDLTNIYVVVVRYFGGTKLGIPGLIEAYKTSTANALIAGTMIEGIVISKVLVNLTFESYPPFLNFCKQHTIPVFEESFDQRVSLIIGFKKSVIKELLLEALKEYSKMDFKDLEEYTAHLDFKIEFLGRDQIM